MDIISQYLLIFVLAAVPWIELLIVIPAGLGMGLNPFPVALLAFAGNAIPVFFIVYGYNLWLNYRAVRRSNSTKIAPAPTKRRQRAVAIWNKYGLPGLALLGPLLTGIHLATIIALTFKPSRKALLWWMNMSLAAWTVGTTIVAFYGIEAIKLLIS
ncbi:small multi-drug export protein [Desulfonatronovibrio magnus]|uniref:small multi-drug export protein n=1 Tax=Desulfonatronovibrio magnus TaxID=698827 RepID=UPI0005EBBDF1|nr:small multi-drug export protein [Desulfonatronovibrio magnus]